MSFEAIIKGFLGSIDAPWSEWSGIIGPDLDHPKGTWPTRMCAIITTIWIMFWKQHSKVYINPKDFIHFEAFLYTIKNENWWSIFGLRTPTADQQKRIFNLY